MKTIPVFFLSLVIAFGVAFPQSADAATANFFGPIISTQCQCPDTAPDWGCVLQTVQNVVNLGISLGVIFGVIVIAWGGILWMTSSINAHNREQARTMLTHAVVGLMIALSAWLLVDFVMKVLYNPDAQAGGVQYGPWNTILADGEQNFCLEKREPPQQPVQTSTQTNNTGTGSGTTNNTGTGTTGDPGVTAGTPNQTTTSIGPGTCPVTSNGLCFQTQNIAAQYSHMSNSLRQLAQCVKGKVPEGRGHISSVSDSMIVSGSKTWQQCAAGQCQHTANSCHYGGTSCVGSSYALDYGDGGDDAVTVSQVLETAAQQCGASINRESNHLHISIGGSCGCDAGL